MGWRTLRMKGYHQVMKTSFRRIGKRHRGLWSFVWSTNLNAAIRMFARDLDVMLIGGIIGSTAVSFYKIAKQFSTMLAQLSEPLYQAIYPELTKLWTNRENDNFKTLMIKSSMTAGILSLVVWVFFLFLGTEIITMIFSKTYLPSYPILIWYMLGVVVAIWGFTLQPAMLAMGKPQISFWIHLCSTIVYFILLVSLVTCYGIVGAALAYLFYYFVWSSSMLCYELKIFMSQGRI
jgi:O-antigen/teichoic acid export membrane protein